MNFRKADTRDVLAADQKSINEANIKNDNPRSIASNDVVFESIDLLDEGDDDDNNEDEHRHHHHHYQQQQQLRQQEANEEERRRRFRTRFQQQRIEQMEDEPTRMIENNTMVSAQDHSLNDSLQLSRNRVTPRTARFGQRRQHMFNSEDYVVSLQDFHVPLQPIQQ